MNLVLGEIFLSKPIEKIKALTSILFRLDSDNVEKSSFWRICKYPRPHENADEVENEYSYPSFCSNPNEFERFISSIIISPLDILIEYVLSSCLVGI